MFPERIETDSLDLKRFCSEHVDVNELYELFAEEREDASEVFRYVPQEPYKTLKSAHDQLDRAEQRWDEGESAKYAVYPKAEESIAGYTTLSMEWKRNTGNVGFIFGKPFWGRGFANECAVALTELAFDRLDLDLVAIGYEEGNEKSKRAIEKFLEQFGGQYDGLLRNWTPIGRKVANHHRYTLSQDQYRSRKE